MKSPFKPTSWYLIPKFSSEPLSFPKGLFIAPHTVAQSIKGAMLVGKVMEEKGYKVIPTSEDIDFVKFFCEDFYMFIS